VLRLWTLFAPLGSLAAGAPVGATSRAWYDELRLAPVVADGLRAQGLDEGEAWGAAERVRPLLDLPLASSLDGPVATLPARLADAWLRDPAIRAFIRVNAWQGEEWFHRESFDELLEWAGRLERVQTPGQERAKRPVEWSVVSRRLAEAADASGYKVDGLRKALAGTAKPAARAASTSDDARLPNATRLPPGPETDGTKVPGSGEAMPEPEVGGPEPG
jgi:hypothetical protein